MTPAQQSLRLAVSSDVRLVTVETARACLGVDAPTVDEMIDSGALYGFDVAPRDDAAPRNQARIREVRIWVGTLEGAKVDLPKEFNDILRVILDHIVGRSPEIPAAQLTQRLSVDDNTVHRLHKLGHLSGSLRRDGSARRLIIDTKSLRQFLSRRLIGG